MINYSRICKNLPMKQALDVIKKLKQLICFNY